MVVEVSDRRWHIMRSSPVPLTPTVLGSDARQICQELKHPPVLVWYGSYKRGCQLRCRPRHLTMVQNYVVRRQKHSCS
ncbi:hypothetical protein TNCV_2109531 [Trichonephila clavipes]|nr:hypothetical protein TNCV_2109531 [Trichonephila clavipes]